MTTGFFSLIRFESNHKHPKTVQNIHPPPPFPFRKNKILKQETQFFMSKNLYTRNQNYFYPKTKTEPKPTNHISYPVIKYVRKQHDVRNRNQKFRFI